MFVVECDVFAAPTALGSLSKYVLMISSMTGFGSAVVRGEHASVYVELKSVNNRYFKLSLRISEGFASLESKIESRIRAGIVRGTINASVRIRREKPGTGYRISPTILQSYFEQILDLGATLGLAGENQHPKLDRLIMLPGVVEEESEIPEEENAQIACLVETALEEALSRLREMRKTEGDSMAVDLTENIRRLRRSIEEVEKQAPVVPSSYRQRLTERIEKIMSEQNLTLNESDLVREVALMADRCDISEETVRFRSHLEQFETAMKDSQSCGRKLDFLTQELFRETNTIGSKANDIEISRNVVEMKTVIERIREMVQNIE